MIVCRLIIHWIKSDFGLDKKQHNHFGHSVSQSVDPCLCEEFKRRHLSNEHAFNGRILWLHWPSERGERGYCNRCLCVILMWLHRGQFEIHSSSYELWLGWLWPTNKLMQKRGEESNKWMTDENKKKQKMLNKNGFISA